MGVPFERSNQATAGSPRIGKGSPNARSQGWCHFVNFPHGINCANGIVRLSALPNSGRATRGLCVTTTWKRRVSRIGIRLPCLPGDKTGSWPGPSEPKNEYDHMRPLSIGHFLPFRASRLKKKVYDHFMCPIPHSRCPGALEK